MQPTPNRLKIPVLIFFIFLISGFVAYRSGAFDELFSHKKELINPAAPEAKEMNPMSISNTSYHDTLTNSLPDSAFTIISSTKSMQVIDFKSLQGIEPPDKMPDSPLLDLIFRMPDSTLKKSIIMSSSKSLIIIEPKPEPRWLYKIDTTTKKQ
jgi:hypothetical protein